MVLDGACRKAIAEKIAKPVDNCWPASERLCSLKFELNDPTTINWVWWRTGAQWIAALYAQAKLRQIFSSVFCLSSRIGLVVVCCFT